MICSRTLPAGSLKAASCHPSHSFFPRIQTISSFICLLFSCNVGRAEKIPTHPLRTLQDFDAISSLCSIGLFCPLFTAPLRLHPPSRGHPSILCFTATRLAFLFPLNHARDPGTASMQQELVPEALKRRSRRTHQTPSRSTNTTTTATYSSNADKMVFTPDRTNGSKASQKVGVYTFRDNAFPPLRSEWHAPRASEPHL